MPTLQLQAVLRGHRGDPGRGSCRGFGVSDPTIILLGRTRQDRRRATRSLEVLDHHQRPCFLYLTRGQAKARAVREAFWRAQNKARGTVLSTRLPSSVRIAVSLAQTVNRPR